MSDFQAIADRVEIEVLRSRPWPVHGVVSLAISGKPAPAAKPHLSDG